MDSVLSPDIHICGACRAEFDCIKEFTQHKQHQCILLRKYYQKQHLADSKTLSTPPQHRTADQTLTASRQLIELVRQASSDEIDFVSDKERGLAARTAGTSDSHHTRGSRINQTELIDLKCNVTDQQQIPPLLKKKSYSSANTVQEKKSNDSSSVNTRGISQLPTIGRSIPAVHTSRRTTNKARKLPQKNYKCSYKDCPFTCAYPKDLKRHLVKHSGEKPYVCPVCSRRYGRKDKLIEHYKNHSEEKRYQCDTCEYKCNEKSALVKHQRIHSGLKPYKCQICMKSFNNTSQLTVHIRIHTGDAPFKCQTCEAAFKINSDLKRHVRIHSGEKPFHCDLCKYSCSVKGNLTVHKRMNHGPNAPSIVCKKCNYVAKSRFDLRTHRDEKHSCSIVTSGNKQQSKNDNRLSVVKATTISNPNKRKAKTNAKLPSGSRSPASGSCVNRKNCHHRCPQCDSSFYREDSLRAHLKQHDQQRPLVDAVQRDLVATAQAVLDLQTPVINNDSSQGSTLIIALEEDCIRDQSSSASVIVPTINHAVSTRQASASTQVTESDLLLTPQHPAQQQQQQQHEQQQHKQQQQHEQQQQREDVALTVHEQHVNITPDQMDNTELTLLMSADNSQQVQTIPLSAFSEIQFQIQPDSAQIQRIIGAAGAAAAGTDVMLHSAGQQQQQQQLPVHMELNQLNENPNRNQNSDTPIITVTGLLATQQQSQWTQLGRGRGHQFILPKRTTGACVQQSAPLNIQNQFILQPLIVYKNDISNCVAGATTSSVQEYCCISVEETQQSVITATSPSSPVTALLSLTTRDDENEVTITTQQ
ncbi:uncharacterized protein LOC141902753 [Tubulanus polymorphus]|uniref:uncharacterized protein LOC141902753 n=1 Tax=Tubulanus polymorphus TaxID=672921 RepID=UPI003DA27AF5